MSNIMKKPLRLSDLAREKFTQSRRDTKNNLMKNPLQLSVLAREKFTQSRRDTKNNIKGIEV